MSKLIANSPKFASKLLHNSTMPAFTLYGARGSTNTDRVRLTLAEGGFTDYEMVYLNLQTGEQKVGEVLLFKDDAACHCMGNLVWLTLKQSEQHLTRHPWGKVPAITFPNRLTLYESRPICKYLASKYSFPLLPSDTEAAALFEQAQSVEMIYFAEPAGRIAFEKFVKKKFMGLPPNDGVVSDALRSVEVFFDVAERLLQDNYMAGKEFTLVDIYYIPLIQRLFECGYGDVILSRKAVKAWWDRCMDRPAIQKMLAADKEAAVRR